MIDSLPNNLWASLFEFLDGKDSFGVATSCRKFAQIIREHGRYWARECINRYFSFDLELFSDIYQCEEYKMSLKSKVLSFTKKSWRQLLIDGEEHKNRFTQTLSKIAPDDLSEAFVSFVFQTLKEPNLPIVNLKRETIVQNTCSLFQNKLSEVLYEETDFPPKKLNFVNDHKALIDELLRFEGQLTQEAALQDKETFLQARWYILEKNSKLLDEAMSFNRDFDDIDLDSNDLPTLKLVSSASRAGSKQDSSYLLNLYDCLRNIITHFCNLVSEFLDSLDNVYDLLTEYIARWKVYVCCMLELEKTFETFTHLFNRSYEVAFEGYPGFPKFSIWRLMTKIWLNEVYEKAGMSANLNAAFLQIMGNYRERNIKCALGEMKINIESLGCQAQNLPKCLFFNLQTKEKILSPNGSLNFNYLSEVSHVNFDDFNQVDKELLADYIQSTLDLSLTEVSIHYLDCSDLPVNCPYKKLEDALISQSKEFYLSYQSLFCECPEYFCNFLKTDGSLLSEMLIKRTQYKFGALQIDYGLHFFKDVLKEQLQNTSLQELSECQIQSVQSFFVAEQGNEEEDLVKGLVKQTLEEIKENYIQGDKCLEELMSDKNIQNISILLEAKYKTLKEDLQYLNSNKKCLDEILINDQYIKNKNINNNIPFEIGDIDCLFYDLDKEVNPTLLQKLYEDYLSFMKQQGLEGEGHQINQINREEQNMEIEQNLEEDEIPDDLTLFGLDNLQLRRALF